MNKTKLIRCFLDCFDHTIIAVIYLFIELTDVSLLATGVDD